MAPFCRRDRPDNDAYPPDWATVIRSLQPNGNFLIDQQWLVEQKASPFFGDIQQ